MLLEIICQDRVQNYPLKSIFNTGILHLAVYVCVCVENIYMELKKFHFKSEIWSLTA